MKHKMTPKRYELLWSALTRGVDEITFELEDEIKEKQFQHLTDEFAIIQQIVMHKWGHLKKENNNEST